MCMRIIVIWRLSGSTIFFYITSQKASFLEKKLLNLKFLVWFPLQISREKLFIYREMSDILSHMYIGIHLK